MENGGWSRSAITLNLELGMRKAQTGILLANHNAGKWKGRERFLATLPARMILTKNKHLLAFWSKPTRGFTAVVSVFWAHLLRSPGTVKSGSNCPAPFMRPAGRARGRRTSALRRRFVSCAR